MWFVDVQSARSTAPRFVENGDVWRLELEIPGARREDVDVVVDRGALRIAARRTTAAPGRLLHAERRDWSQDRRFSLPDGVSPDSVAATLEHGVLTVTVQKPTPVLPRRIDVH
jgi:HSP20 family protein